MSRHLAAEPTTDAQLFDMLHGLFGIGDFDDSGEVPWFKFRMTEISKIKAMRKKRQLSLKEMALAARYAYRKGVNVKASWEIPAFIMPATKAAKVTQVSPLGMRIREAVDNERSRPDGSEEWATRLLRARGEFRREVLGEWERERS